MSKHCIFWALHFEESSIVPVIVLFIYLFTHFVQTERHFIYHQIILAELMS